GVFFRLFFVSDLLVSNRFPYYPSSCFSFCYPLLYPFHLHKKPLLALFDQIYLMAGADLLFIR
ncbi:hypothetical protein, partial [Yersinia enterocolitica]|uniref:hypothetical protein n=1 Tax=Yersinia enterocolitica TaxID=630 RepID=UPI001E410C53